MNDEIQFKKCRKNHFRFMAWRNFSRASIDMARIALNGSAIASFSNCTRTRSSKPFSSRISAMARARRARMTGIGLESSSSTKLSRTFFKSDVMNLISSQAGMLGFGSKVSFTLENMPRERLSGGGLSLYDQKNIGRYPPTEEQCCDLFKPRRGPSRAIARRVAMARTRAR